MHLSSQTQQTSGSAASAWEQAIDEVLQRRYDEVVALRRHLHAHPEPSGEELETTLHLYKLLSDEDVQVREGFEGRGVIADLEQSQEVPKIAVRADIDALRIQDAKSVPYRSQNDGIMHACGHDAHSATVFGAVAALAELAKTNRLPWPINLRGIFQPAEETAQGAHEMIRAGAMDGVTAILGTHMDPSRVVGNVAIRSGVLTAHCDEMGIIVTGRGGHAARPHLSIDPIAAAAQLISSIYLFVPRATDSQDAVVVTIGRVSGGYDSNVIPEHVELAGTIRTLDKNVRRQTKEHIAQLVRGIAETSGTRISVDFHEGIDSVINDPALAEFVTNIARRTLGSQHVEIIPRPSMGSEDFAAYLEHAPGVMYRVGCSIDGNGAPLHTPTFDIDERALFVSARVLARSVVQWSDPQRWQNS